MDNLQAEKEKIRVNFKTFDVNLLKHLKALKLLIFQKKHSIIKTILKIERRNTIEYN